MSHWATRVGASSAWPASASRGSGLFRSPRAPCTAHGLNDLAFTGGELALTAYVIPWTSAVISSMVDNIPFMLGAFPLLLLSIAISHLYIGWRYLT